jgi:hypothetical protein
VSGGFLNITSWGTGFFTIAFYAKWPARAVTLNVCQTKDRRSWLTLAADVDERFILPKNQQSGPERHELVVRHLEKIGKREVCFHLLDLTTCQTGELHALHVYLTQFRWQKLKLQSESKSKAFWLLLLQLLTMTLLLNK